MREGTSRIKKEKTKLSSVSAKKKVGTKKRQSVDGSSRGDPWREVRQKHPVWGY